MMFKRLISPAILGYLLIAPLFLVAKESPPIKETFFDKVVQQLSSKIFEKVNTPYSNVIDIEPKKYKKITSSFKPVVSGGNIDIGINSSDDDAYDGSSNNAKLLLGDSEASGVRFEGITIPSGATITNAYLQFTSVANRSNTPSSVNIYGENLATPADYDPDNNVSGRTKTNQLENWNLGTWVSDAQYNSPDISTIIEELIATHGPYSNGTMAFILDSQSSEVREASSYDDSPSTAPRLIIEYIEPNVISGKVFEDIDGSQTQNGGEGGLNGIQVLLFEDNDQSGTNTAGDTQIDDVLTAGDGDYSFTINNVYSGCVEEQVNASENDARDGNSGENSLSMGKDNTIGVRFTDITIPTGATITSAYLEFKARSDGDKNTSSVNIYADDQNSPADYDPDDAVASRPQSTAVQPWTFGEWLQDVSYSSPDITNIIQELISSYGPYTNGTMAFILDSNGSEERQAYSFDDGGANAPRLVINYTIPGSNYYITETVAGTYPAGGNLTTDNVETAIFSAAGQTDTSNDFGITLCGPTLVQSTQSTCNDNGTTSTADDFFTIAVLATDNAGNATQKYEIVYNGTVLNPGGTDYGVAFTIGTGQEFSADGSSTYAITLRDFDDNTCAIGFTTTPVNPCQVDLELTMEAEETLVEVGEDAIFTITISNKDLTTFATGVEVTEYLPASLNTPSGSASQGTYDPNTGIWLIDTLTTNSSATLTLTAEVNSNGFITSTAQVTAQTEEDIDSSPNNDDGDQSEDDEAVVTIFDASTCADGTSVFNAITACNDNGTPQTTDDYYVVSINLSGSGTFDVDGSYGGNNFVQTGLSYNTTHVLSPNIPIGTHLDLVTTDGGSGDCTYARILSPGSCSGIITCYAISDEGNPDNLFKYTSATNTWTNIGSTGRGGIEALAYNPFTNQIYTASDDQFGTTDTLNAGFTSIGTGVGTMSGPEGNWNVGDIDGLTFDPNSGILWASERREDSSTDNDYIFQIDVTTGDFIPDAFGPNVDYIVVQEVFDPINNQLVYDVDDIAIDPATGDLYVISNRGGTGGVLTIINKTNGNVKTVIGNFGDVDDMEALGFYNSGLLYGSTGNNGPDAGDNNKFYAISKVNGSLTQLSAIDPSGTQVDFEACDCLTGLPSELTGRVYLDADLSTSLTNAETGTSGIIVELYLDKNGDGAYTVGVDELANTQQTDVNGDYVFDIAAIGDYVVRVDPNSLPANHVLVTENIHTGQFFDIGLTDANNDFGYAPASTDIELVKRVNNASPTVGETVTFSLVLKNVGTIDATGIAVEDVVPSGYNNITNISDSGSNAAGTITWSGLNVDKLDSLTLTFDADVLASGDYTNTAQVTAMTETDDDSTPNNDDGDQSEDDEDSVSVTPEIIDLELTKTVSNTAPLVGSTITFSIKVKNAGSANATGVAVQDVVPNGYNNIANISNAGTNSSGTITWSALSINANDSLTLTFDADVLASGNYTNTAQVTAANEPDSDSAPNNDDGDQSEDDEDNASVTPEAIDLELTKTVNNTAPFVGSTVTFSIKVKNAGSTSATGVAVQDVVPNGYNNIANISDAGTNSSGTITWSALSINANDSLTLTFDANVLASGDYINTAQVTAANEPDSDSAPNNDDGDQSEDDEDNASVTPESIDLELTKTVSNTAPLVGSTITFSIKVKNAGSTSATGVAVQDVVPNGYNNIANISDAGTNSSGTITWSALSINANDSLTLTFDADVLASGDYINTAQVTAANEPDSDSTPNNDDGDQSEDDEDSAATTPQTPANVLIGLAKAASNITDNGDGTFEVTYLVKVESFGDEMYDVQVTDNLTTEFGTHVVSAIEVDVPGEYTITSPPSITESTGGATVANVNNAFDGDGTSTLISPAAGESMPTGSTITLSFSMKFYPATNKTAFQNQATGSGDIAEDGNADGDSIDLSDDGACVGSSANPTSNSGYILTPEPDINCNGNPNEVGENDPTYFHITPSTNCPAEAGTLGF